MKAWALITGRLTQRRLKPERDPPETYAPALRSITGKQQS